MQETHEGLSSQVTLKFQIITEKRPERLGHWSFSARGKREGDPGINHDGPARQQTLKEHWIKFKTRLQHNKVNIYLTTFLYV